MSDTVSFDLSKHVTLWAFCRRNLADTSRTMNFLCKRGFGRIFVTRMDFTYLNTQFLADQRWRYRWGRSERRVAEIAKRLLVHEPTVLAYLISLKFDPKITTNPNRKERDEWVERVWKVIE